MPGTVFSLFNAFLLLSILGLIHILPAWVKAFKLNMTFPQRNSSVGNSDFFPATLRPCQCSLLALSRLYNGARNATGALLDLEGQFAWWLLQNVYRFYAHSQWCKFKQSWNKHYCVAHLSTDSWKNVKHVPISQSCGTMWITVPKNTEKLTQMLSGVHGD